MVIVGVVAAAVIVVAEDAGKRTYKKEETMLMRIARFKNEINACIKPHYITSGPFRTNTYFMNSVQSAQKRTYYSYFY